MYDNDPDKQGLLADLESLGGDMEAALVMGRILRQKRALAVVRDGSKCFSSCVFLLAGAPMRLVEPGSAVGIHRPYLTVDNATTPAAQKEQYERIEKDVKRFLRDMNIPEELYDHMFRIPPERVKVLSQADLEPYGLSDIDPYEKAAADARQAKAMGLSTEEYIRRKAKARAECWSGTAYSPSCEARILKQGR